ncbi:MAG: rhodanese-like domain-containing protein [Deltaproteobacteria bacterium]|nr:rhodanese-like domain-containing protein [Deltaproteobacteria bacterium]
MKSLLAAAALALSAVPAAALACDGAGEKQVSRAPWQPVTVDALATRLEKKAVTVFDANHEDFRAKNGVLPGAKLLSSSSSYDVEKELPAQKDTALVFYCANEKCTASHKAAERAAAAGFKEVSVLTVGFKGWKAAGKPTESLPRS